MSLWIPPTVKKIINAILFVWMLPGVIYYYGTFCTVIGFHSLPTFKIHLPPESYYTNYHPKGDFFDYVYILHFDALLIYILLYLPLFLFFWIKNEFKSPISYKALIIPIFTFYLVSYVGTHLRDSIPFDAWGWTPEYIWSFENQGKPIWCSEPDGNSPYTCRLGNIYSSVVSMFIALVYIPLYLLWRGVGGRIMS